MATLVEEDHEMLMKEMSEEDLQDQMDEMEVLQSIYENDIVINKESSLKSFHMNIKVEVDEDKGIEAEFYNSNLSTEKIAGPFTLKHLIPMKLHVSFPYNYPSEAKPNFSLQCDWLSYTSMKKICIQLDEIWQGDGMVVIFEWIDWIKNDMMDFLEIKKLNIGKEESLSRQNDNNNNNNNNDTNKKSSSLADLREKRLQFFAKNGDIDRRAIPGWCLNASKNENFKHLSYLPKVEQLMGNLLQYNNYVEHKLFMQKTHTCKICWSEEPATKYVFLQACNHYYCKECVVEHLRLHIKEGSVEKLICPDPKCATPIIPSQIAELVSKDDFARWEKVLLQKTLDSMQDIVYCPRPNCNSPVIEESDNLAQCPKCMYAFCSLCRLSWHPGTICMTAEERIKAMEARAKRSGGGIDMAEFIRKQTEFINEQKTRMTLKKNNCKECPSCKNYIEKTEGCNKMHCRCGVYFCFLCGEDITQVGYGHFGEGKRCQLFSIEAIKRWNALMGGQDVRQERMWRVQAMGINIHTAQRKGCPYCGQEVIKEGKNNHMNCFACRKHFCFLCGLPVRKGDKHFGPGKPCKQHS